MSTKRMLLTVLAASAVLLALVLGSQLAGSAQARPPAQPSGPANVTVPYPGRLADVAGQPVPDGAYDFAFTLYAAETGGAPLWSEVQKGVPVQSGAFQAALGSVQPIPPAALNGLDAWLAVAVRGPGEADFVALIPRQRVSAAAPTAPDSPSAGLACPHDHLFEMWVGSSTGAALWVENTGNGSGIEARSAGSAVDYEAALYAKNTYTGYGVLAESRYGTGVAGYTSDQNGFGGEFQNTQGGIALYVYGTGVGNTKAALQAENWSGIAAYLRNSNGYPTLELDQSGDGRVLDLQNGGDSSGEGGGDFIAGFSKDSSFDMQFRITSTGQGRSDVGWTTPAEDFAEMLPAVAGLAPGDVLVIGPDGKLTRSTEAYQASVAGVYSTAPGFVGGQPVEGAVPGTIPLAIVGVVPVKVSAENGVIQPGDLLVASSTPGYAMRAGPNPPQGTVIGKALEKWAAGTGIIQMLATLQ
ncbi:MAG: hypothetical protein KKA73_03930 [Chloroflexi bacterium]|nr:hypothetical protein [Chloroflexota bacterium]MBU1746814.1 hypothetical protein [Chloroflexota bacterium]